MAGRGDGDGDGERMVEQSIEEALPHQRVEALLFHVKPCHASI
jgi:hypothetical protein